MECNWKVMSTTILRYHLPSVHPSLNRELDYGKYETETSNDIHGNGVRYAGAENEATVERRYKQSEGTWLRIFFGYFQTGC